MKRETMAVRSVCILLLAALAFPAAAQTRTAQWPQVREAMNQQLPRTAIEHLDPIIESAIADRTWPEAIRAHWTWQYFQQNRWRFVQRTQTDEPPGDDIRFWDLARILEEVDARFTAALENEAELKATPIETYDALLEKGTVPDAHRPTLFDFLAHEALSFYSAGEQGALQAEDAFAVPAESPVFDEIDAFLAWDPEAADTGSPLAKAIRLYQRLLAFHRNALDPTAFIDADLERLRFGFNQAFG